MKRPVGQKWVVGQRVVAEFEPELGSGIVVHVTGERFIEVLFPDSEVARRYAAHAAPLKRHLLPKGKKAKSKKGISFTITDSREVNGLILYSGDGVEAWEYEIEATSESRGAVDVLLSGRWSEPELFELRNQAWRLKSRSLNPAVKGLVGARVSLLPHQLYIASEVAHREFPRCLLADEVGLGKTIEAGLIFSALRALGRADRVLVLVPDALKHQWLAELYRRFNELFTVVDEERSEAEEQSQGRTAFSENQRIICSQEFLLENPVRLEEAMAEPWDLLIIDEAHHLEWSEGEDSSPEWEIAQLLSQRSRGLLLLTATPENHGVKTEFGLLNLVDPERFPDYARFEQEATRWQKTATLARRVFHNERDPKLFKELERLGTHTDDPSLKEAIAAYVAGAEPGVLLRPLVDRHGTGRCLMRNRRSRLSGFPERKLNPHPIPPPKEWMGYLQTLPALDDAKLLGLASGQRKLPQEAAKQWLAARAKWLLWLIQSLPGEKALLIGSSAQKAVALQEWLRANATVRTALFHEDMEIVERDRQAAWFQETNGAQILLCSEIGSEGRNFQFAHHLVVFDLPLHPDVLEQRIGRLDRIGQRDTVQIHVPYLEGTPEEAMFRWYAEGLETFTTPWNLGDAASPLMPTLSALCRAFLPQDKNYRSREKQLKTAVAATRKEVATCRERQKESVDVLIDINSFDEAKGTAIAAQIRATDEDKELRQFLDAAFDHFGVEVEDMGGERVQKVTAHSLTYVEHFPGLTAHGERLVTCDRNVALAREDVAFLTWDHPIAQGAMSLVLEKGVGQAAVAAWPDAPEPVILELLYVLQTVAPARLETERDLPLSTYKLYVTMEGKPVEPKPDVSRAVLSTLSARQIDTLLEVLRRAIPEIVEKANGIARKQARSHIEQALSRREERLKEEIKRLEALAKINSLVTAREIQSAKDRMRQGLEAIRSTEPVLDSLRLFLRE